MNRFPIDPWLLEQRKTRMEYLESLPMIMEITLGLQGFTENEAAYLYGTWSIETYGEDWTDPYVPGVISEFEAWLRVAAAKYY